MVCVNSACDVVRTYIEGVIPMRRCLPCLESLFNTVKGMSGRSQYPVLLSRENTRLSPKEKLLTIFNRALLVDFIDVIASNLETDSNKVTFQDRKRDTDRMRATRFHFRSVSVNQREALDRSQKISYAVFGQMNRSNIQVLLARKINTILPEYVPSIKIRVEHVGHGSNLLLTLSSLRSKDNPEKRIPINLTCRLYITKKSKLNVNQEVQLSVDDADHNVFLSDCMPLRCRNKTTSFSCAAAPPLGGRESMHANKRCKYGMS